MKTTYYLVAAAAVAAAGVTIYARITGDGPPAPTRQARAAEVPRDVPRLALPPVSIPPEAPEPPELPTTLPLTVPVVKPASASEPRIPAIPATPIVPPVVVPKPAESPLPDVVPKLDVPVVPPPTIPVSNPVIVQPQAAIPPAAAPVMPESPLPITASPPLIPSLPQPSNPPLPVAKPPIVAPAVPISPVPLPTPKPVIPPAPTPLPAPKLLPVPGSDVAPRPAANEPPGDAGKFVVLNDNKLVEGSGVSIEGNTIRVRQGALDRPFHKSQVQFVASSKDEVYKFMLAKVSADDLSGRLKVARWCMFSGMREQALVEAQAIQKLQPTSTAAADLVRSLELSLRQFPPAGAPKMIAPERPTFPVELRTPEPPASEPEPDVTPEASLVFGSRVQPFLANQCVGCHVKADHAGAFKLVRITTTDAGPQATRANLRAVAAQLKQDDPAASPLLAKTLVAHGGMKQPAVASRNSVAYRALEAWVLLAVGRPLTPPMPAPQQPVMPQTVTTPAPSPMPEPALPEPPGVSIPASPTLPPPMPEAVPVLPPTPEPVPSGVTVPTTAPVLPFPPVEVAPVPTPKPLPPAIPPIPPDDMKEKPRPLPIPPARVRAKPQTTTTPASGTKFGEVIPPKPPVTGPSGDEFDPAGFNQPGK